MNAVANWLLLFFGVIKMTERASCFFMNDVDSTVDAVLHIHSHGYTGDRKIEFVRRVSDELRDWIESLDVTNRDDMDGQVKVPQ